MRGVMGDDEKRVLARADDDHGGDDHQGIRPICQRDADGDGEHHEVLDDRERRAPCRAARQLLDEVPGKSATVVVLEFLAGHSPISTYFTSRNSSSPYLDPSRPSPDCLTPPNGATSVEMMPAFAPTMPVSIFSATRKMRPMSRL